MDDLIHKAFRDFIVDAGKDCGLPLPLWENDAQCNDDHLRGCSDDIVWVVQYGGPARNQVSCNTTQATGFFQLSLFARPGCGTGELYKISRCLICAIENACKQYASDRYGSVTLYLTGLNNSLPTTGGLIPNTPSGRALLPITVPFRAFYCC